MENHTHFISIIYFVIPVSKLQRGREILGRAITCTVCEIHYTKMGFLFHSFQNIYHYFIYYRQSSINSDTVVSPPVYFVFHSLVVRFPFENFPSKRHTQVTRMLSEGFIFRKKSDTDYLLHFYASLKFPHRY